MTFLGHKVKDQHQKLATTFDQENGLNHLQNNIIKTKSNVLEAKYGQLKLNFLCSSAEGANDDTN